MFHYYLGRGEDSDGLITSVIVLGDKTKSQYILRKQELDF